MQVIETSDSKRNRPVERAAWPATGFVTITQILGAHGGPIPVSRSRWYAGIAKGEFPRPISVGGRAVWRVQDINDLIDRLEREATPPLPRGVRKSSSH